MLKDLFSNRLFIGALAFFILCVVGGTLYISHVEKQGAEELSRDKDSGKQLTEKQQQRPTAEAPIVEQTPQGHFHSDGTFHAEPHDAPVEVSEAEVSADVPAAPVVTQQANTEIDAATLESAARRLKDPDVSKAWIEWSEKARELRRKHMQAAGEAVALLPTTEEEFERIKNDPDWQRRRNEALHKTAEIHTRLKAHEKKNPLFQ